MTKNELRQQIRERLRALSPEVKAAKSKIICSAIEASAPWAESLTIALYAPLPIEPDLTFLKIRQSHRICFPTMVGERLSFHWVTHLSDLVPSRWNLLEPRPEESTYVPPEEIDLLLIPGMAFTLDGDRMGKGKGFYDRYLSQPGFRACTFGVCFQEQIVAALPKEPHDLPVQRVFFA